MGTVERFLTECDIKHVDYDDSNITRTPYIHSGLSKYIRYHSLNCPRTLNNNNYSIDVQSLSLFAPGASPLLNYLEC